MRIEVLEILDAERREVRFRSELGDAWGVWQADVVPSEGQFDVEVDIPEEISTWLPGEGDADRLDGDPSRRQAVTVRGTVQTVDEDSVTSLRVGRDIVLIEMANETVPPQPGSTITFETPEIHLYPYQL
ncbi:hypothetical protein ABZ953_08280 [Streptomyces sp. NPDC046465]|uniref:hypothetical protein n=1 Tax=Streptomyces sp. NPDC046465 TaxID=3155810 RepID=UPI0033C0B40C